MTKTCRSCGVEKHAWAFRPDRRLRGGLFFPGAETTVPLVPAANPPTSRVSPA